VFFVLVREISEFGVTEKVQRSIHRKGYLFDGQDGVSVYYADREIFST
jgi:hypothetical protein